MEHPVLLRSTLKKCCIIFLLCAVLINSALPVNIACADLLPSESLISWLAAICQRSWIALPQHAFWLTTRLLYLHEAAFSFIILQAARQPMWIYITHSLLQNPI